MCLEGMSSSMHALQVQASRQAESLKQPEGGHVQQQQQRQQQQRQLTWTLWGGPGHVQC